MSAITLNLPHSIQRHLQELAAQDGVDVNQFVTSAVTEKIAAITAEGYLRQRAARADPQALVALLDRAPARMPVPGDE